MMKEIKEIKKSSLANILAMVYSFFGFLMATGTYSSTFLKIVARGDENGPLFQFILFNIGIAILVGVFVAIILGGFGWIIGFLTAYIYNAFAKNLGGVKVELVDAIKKDKVHPKGMINGEAREGALGQSKDKKEEPQKIASLFRGKFKEDKKEDILDN